VNHLYRLSFGRLEVCAGRDPCEERRPAFHLKPAIALLTGFSGFASRRLVLQSIQLV
jgi:hypothetical protein